MHAPVPHTHPVVVPLPPVDFRIAATSLRRVSAATTDIASTAARLQEADSDAWYALRGKLEASIESLPDAVLQSRRAVELLSASSEQGASAFATVIKADVLEPLTRAVGLLPTLGTSSKELGTVETTMTAIGGAAQAWADTLDQRPVVVHSPMPAD